MFQVIGIIFGVVSIVPMLKFIDEDSMTRAEKMIYPIIGICLYIVNNQLISWGWGMNLRSRHYSLLLFYCQEQLEVILLI